MIMIDHRQFASKLTGLVFDVALTWGFAESDASTSMIGTAPSMSGGPARCWSTCALCGHGGGLHHGGDLVRGGQVVAMRSVRRHWV